MGLSLHIALSLALSLGFAALSWPLVERPALALKSRLGRRKRGGTPPSESLSGVQAPLSAAGQTTI